MSLISINDGMDFDHPNDVWGEIMDRNLYDQAVMHMDDEIREWLHMRIAPCTELRFLKSYCYLHFKKYNEYFVI